MQYATVSHQNLNFSTVSRDRHARSYERVTPSTGKFQFHYSFVRSTRTILRKGCSVNSKMSILIQFRAIDWHDLMKRLQRAPQKKKYYSFARSTRTIFRKGCSVPSKMPILLQFRAINRHDLTKGLQRAPQKIQFCYSFARSTRTILRTGRISASIFRTIAPPLYLLS